ncbi:Tetratricopeptide repeat-containing protein [Fibrobacter sp. UWH9]|uniref:tetratricopeptide repeat protein n=1 Tax=unclassified Fibrobacter TaxID=2634177 RepID=UPI00090F7E73|nr:MULTISPECIES: tetratricopeptide repeat protein [Fibrobacter]MCQ2100354.1 tetratricopeptide repeat protein [Fibrobacter sp.]MCL4101150.1 Cell division coordinator CpoB [Fibrobacter succinogenes]MDO4947133.1 tetratricopeptide repeat protein [Fibrobacter sp.]SHG64189.1 Tetratricopeptide repeat-containing protein [Fibrobacter sp. UWH9]SHK87616.1 Tetratricopeptide repeat-containing protein [Fibrobacter sp. UWH5]
MRSSFIKTAVLGLTVASTSLFAEATYSPHKYQQNDWFAEFGGNTAMYVNPAGIAETEQLEFSAAFFSSISGEASQEYVSLTFPMDYKHTLGLSFFENGASIDGGKSYGEYSWLLGYAYNLMQCVALGIDVSVLYINQFDDVKHLTVGADVGVSWNPLASSKYGYLLVGVALQNLAQPGISMEEDGGSFVAPGFFGGDRDDAYNIPSNLNLSFFYRGLNRSLEAKAEISLIDVFHSDTEGGDGVNPEMSFTLTYYLSSHLGVRLRFTKEGYPVAGATVNVKDVSIFRYLALDLEMSHDDLYAKKNRGFIWAVKITSRFGDTREEKIGEERYRRLKIEPENDYRAAMRLYLNRQFLEAAYAFGKVQTKYPAFHLVDQAAFYKAKSFENLRMHKAAKSVYEDAIKRYPQSDQRAKYHFQLMNIDYKEGKYTDAMAKYQAIAQKFGESDVKADADYVAGQIKFEQGLYQESVDLLAAILPGNANYFYARYTMGIAYSRLGKFDEAENCFRDITEQPVSNQSERDLQDAARVKLGHLFFSGEKADIGAAAQMYGQVQPGSPVYDEAMLGIAWSFLKVNKPNEAMKPAQWIVSNLPESFLVSEAYLVIGYCHFMKKDYNGAVKALEQAEKRTEQPVVSVAARDSARQAYEAMQDDFDSVQVKALDLARQLPTPRVESKREALKPSFDKANAAIEDYAAFNQRAIQSDRFESNRKRILDDAGFTLATVKTKMGQGAGVSQEAQQELDELEDLE